MLERFRRKAHEVVFDDSAFRDEVYHLGLELSSETGAVFYPHALLEESTGVSVPGNRLIFAVPGGEGGLSFTSSTGDGASSPLTYDEVKESLVALAAFQRMDMELKAHQVELDAEVARSGVAALVASGLTVTEQEQELLATSGLWLSEDVRFFVSAENGEPSFVRKAYDQDGDGIQAPLPLNAFRDELGDLLPVIREFSSEPSVAFKQDVFEPRVNIKPPTQRSVSSDQSLDVSKGRG